MSPNIRAVATALRGGRRYPPLIAVESGQGDLILVEGYTRATAYALTGLPSLGDVRRESCSRGYRGMAWWAIVDPAGNARSYFLGAARETAHPGEE